MYKTSLKCINNNDKFTVNSNYGNGVLTYPVALITSYELAYAGGYGFDYNTSSFIKNTNFYLYTPSYYYWTMTPLLLIGMNKVYLVVIKVISLCLLAL